MIGFIAQLLELVKSLLPSSTDNNKVLLAKTAFLGFLSALCFSGGFYLLTRTTFGEQYNIRLIENPPELTTTEMILTDRAAWKALSRLRVEYNEDIRAVFFMALIDSKTRNIVQQDDIPSRQTQLYIWKFEIPVDRWGRAIETVEELANELKPTFETELRRTRRCLTFMLKGDEVEVLKQRINNFVSTHASICPVYTFDTPRLIGATLMFFRIKPPRAPWFYEEQLQIATSDLSVNYRSFKIKYLTVYE